MLSSVAFGVWLALFVALAVRIKAWRRAADDSRLLTLVAGFVVLTAVVALFVAPPDFGGVVLISLGLSIGGSAGAVLVKRTGGSGSWRAFAVARAAGAIGLLWLVAAILASPGQPLEPGSVDWFSFVALLLAGNFAAAAAAGFVITALPKDLVARLRARADGLPVIVPCAAVWILALLISVFAMISRDAGVISLAVGAVALATSWTILRQENRSPMSRSALLDASAAAGAALLGFAVEQPMAMAVGGFAAAASFGMAQRFARRKA